MTTPLSTSSPAAAARLDVRHGADADDDDVRGQPGVPSVTTDGDPAGAAELPRPSVSVSRSTPCSRCSRAKTPPISGAQHRVQRGGLRLDDGHLRCRGAGGRGHLQADPARPDDHDAAAAPGEVGAAAGRRRRGCAGSGRRPGRRRARAAAAATSRSPAAAWRRPAPPPCRASPGAPAGRGRSARTPVRRSTSCSAYQPAACTRGALPLGLAEQVALGQRRPLVGRLRLLADEHDAARRSPRRAASRPPWRRPARRRRSRTGPGRGSSRGQPPRPGRGRRTPCRERASSRSSPCRADVVVRAPRGAHAAQRHAQVLGLDDDADAARGEVAPAASRRPAGSAAPAPGGRGRTGRARGRAWTARGSGRPAGSRCGRPRRTAAGGARRATGPGCAVARTSSL